MTALIVLIAIAFVALILYRVVRQHQENYLRSHFPQRRVIEVSLPRGIDDSNERMQRFYRKAVAAAQGGPQERKKGERQIDIVYLAEVHEGHTMPEVRFLLYTDPDKMNMVKKTIKQVFDGMASVVELDPKKEDPMEEIAAQLRPPKAASSDVAVSVSDGEDS